MRGQLASRLQALLPHLNERQRRLLLAAEARGLGHGGIRIVARAVGVSETTVRKGVAELDTEPLPDGRVRRPGGGRKTAAEKNPNLLPALLALVEPDERGDPMSPLRWTTKSLRNLSNELTKQGHKVSATTVGKLLRKNGFSLQANVKTLEGKQHPDRDAQFHYINSQVKEHQAAGEPVISVDTKKKELVGQFHNPGREWRPKGDPIDVEDHSLFARPGRQQVIPYGIYDIAANTGWVNVGVDHDTSAFAVASIRRWWESRGRTDYPSATRLLITADSGGSNSPRYRLWKSELAALAQDMGMAITVCHFPPGTSKWNKVEHRLFSHITMNWRGRPLTSHEVVIKTIASTRTRCGLRVEAELDTRDYPTGISVSKEYADSLPIEPHESRGTWNYTVLPHKSDHVSAPRAERPQGVNLQTVEMLSDPRLTGMSREELTDFIECLAPIQEARDEQRRYERRGGKRRRTRGAGAISVITPAARILAAVLYLREVIPMMLLSELLCVEIGPLRKAINETHRIFTDHSCVIRPVTLRLTSEQAICDYLATETRERPEIPLELLTDPSITGMSREELLAMTDRVLVRYRARLEELRIKRRGRELHKLPGLVSQRKITDADRVLAAVLGMRRIATRKAIADLFGVSARTIGNTLVELRPLLEADGYNPTLILRAQRFYTAEELLRSAPATGDLGVHSKP
jgi:transposase